MLAVKVQELPPIRFDCTTARGEYSPSAPDVGVNDTRAGTLRSSVVAAMPPVLPTNFGVHARPSAVTLPTTCETDPSGNEVSLSATPKCSFGIRNCTPAIALPSAGGVTSKSTDWSAVLELRHWLSLLQLPPAQSPLFWHSLCAMVL